MQFTEIKAVSKTKYKMNTFYKDIKTENISKMKKSKPLNIIYIASNIWNTMH